MSARWRDEKRTKAFHNTGYYAHADLPGSRPANPLAHTQAGVLEHQQIYLSELSTKDHAECVSIIIRHKGSRRPRLNPYITHIVVDTKCPEQEKKQIVKFLEEVGNACQVVSLSWLRACDEVCSSMHMQLQES